MAYLLDTNVVSELQKGLRCDANAWAWYDLIPMDQIFLSVITLGEMRRGVETKRRRDSVTARVYEKWLREVILMHRERVLPVTAEICEIWGGLGASGQINPVDALIAATAVCYNFTLATRNTRDFQRCGVDYINPFEA